MKFITLSLSSFHPVRLLCIVFMCAMLVFGSTVPAYAANTPKSQPTEGAIHLDRISQRAEDVATSPPMTMNEAIKRSKEGLNEVQGAADKSKMIQADDSRPAIVEDLERAAK